MHVSTNFHLIEIKLECARKIEDRENYLPIWIARTKSARPLRNGVAEGVKGLSGMRQNKFCANVVIFGISILGLQFASRLRVFLKECLYGKAVYVTRTY